jgi:hypothetical protein
LSSDRQFPSVRATGTPKAAVSAQIRKSHAAASAQPPPTATPSIAAMVGIRSRSTRSTTAPMRRS